jgi:hypothetical protein
MSDIFLLDDFHTIENAKLKKIKYLYKKLRIQ